MAAMDQAKLNSMASSVQKSADDYVAKVGNSVSDLLETFNNNWVSGAAQNLASEISEKLNILSDTIASTLNNKNQDILESVNHFNTVEEEDISYNGFSVGKPNVDLRLNQVLPSGKVGVASGANLGTINDPISRLILDVDNALAEIETTVSGADAFDVEEQDGLSNSIKRARITFDDGMKELKTSLHSRMSDEIKTRSVLDANGIARLER